MRKQYKIIKNRKAPTESLKRTLKCESACETEN